MMKQVLINTCRVIAPVVHPFAPPHPGDAVSRVQLQAGDDAGDVAWIQASSQLRLYASHTDFIKEVVKRKNAAW